MRRSHPSSAVGSAIRRSTLAVAAALVCLAGGRTSAQGPAMPRVTFADAVQRAIARNPSAAVAAAQILRADALVRQARAATLLAVTGNVSSTTAGTTVTFEDTTVTPRTQVTASLDVAMPLYAPAAWARKAQAADQKDVATLGAAETRRQIAVAAALAYLEVVANHRLVEGNERARVAAKAHYDFAHTQLEAGRGSLLNELRAQQELSSTEVLLEAVSLALYRSQEALGVVLAADGPMDTLGEPVFEVPADIGIDEPTGLALARPDLRLFSAQEQAADRVVRDSFKDRLPVVQGVFTPQATYPSQFFLPSKTWRAVLFLSVPVFDSGLRAGFKQERQASLDAARADSAGALMQARAEVRAARESIRSAARAVASARAAAEQAGRVLEIVTISFKAGASTNLEVIDAERRARDTDNAAAIAEDVLRRAKLDLLNALGRFPGDLQP
jgi:outer membrane protein